MCTMRVCTQHKRAQSALKAIDTLRPELGAYSSMTMPWLGRSCFQLQPLLRFPGFAGGGELPSDSLGRLEGGLQLFLLGLE